LQDLSELLQEDPNLLPLMIPAAVGVGSNTYGADAKSRLLGDIFPEELDFTFPEPRQRRR
jgi:hypothetical protein